MQDPASRARPPAPPPDFNQRLRRPWREVLHSRRAASRRPVRVLGVSVLVHSGVVGVAASLLGILFLRPGEERPVPSISLQARALPQVERIEAPPRTVVCEEALPQLEELPVELELPPDEAPVWEARALASTMMRRRFEYRRPEPRVVEQAQPVELSTPVMAQPLPDRPTAEPVLAVEPKAPVYHQPRLDRERCPAPPYPRSARRRQLQGVARIGVEVSAEGKALRTWLVESSGHPSLDEAAQKAVKDWGFHPATLDGQAVEGRLSVPVRFRLQA